MKRKVASGIMLALLLIGMLTLASNIQSVSAQEPPIEIWSDYTLDRDITFSGDGFIVKANDVTLDLNGHTITGSGNRFGVDLYVTSGVVVKNGTIRNFAYGIYLGWSDDNTICGNTITNNIENGIGLSLSDYNMICGNKITNNRDGIELTLSDFNMISGNKITNNNWDGIIVSHWSEGNAIFGNSITNNGYDGVLILEAHGNTIFENNITNNNYGVYFHFSPELTWFRSNWLSGNNIANNDLYGVFLLHSPNNILTGNSITNNYEGIFFQEESFGNKFAGNKVTENIFGVVFYNSSDNKIYHNNLNNAIQVYSENSINTWDDGYPSGGNYWSDQYHGECADHFSGPGQNISGSDGVVDTPYVIDADNQDNYPLMEPIVYYQLTVSSLPVTGITFTINGFLQTTPYAEWFSEGSFTLEMPETHDTYFWARWLEDGDTNRTRTFVLTGNTTLTGGFTIIIDINHDGIVNVFDLRICAKAFGSKPGDINWNPTVDLNNDGLIDIFDLRKIAKHYGKRIW